MNGAQTATEEPADAHVAALRRAYELVEAAQDRDVAGQIDVLDDRAQAAGWIDVSLLAHFARSLAAQDAGLAPAEPLQAMMDAARILGDPALMALTLARGAQQAADARHLRTLITLEADPLVRAVAMLEGCESLLVHRVAAHIEVAGVFHLLGLWELAKEQYSFVTVLFECESDATWIEVLRRQRRVVDANHLDLNLDMACALAEADDWDGARRLAHGALPATLTVLDNGWPGTWAATVHAYAELFASLCGEPSPADREFVAGQAQEPDTDINIAMLTIADAIRARRAGDFVKAAHLAGLHRTTIGPDLPVHLHLLTLSLAAHGLKAEPAALEYIRELVTLRWNSRLSRLEAMNASIEAERRRTEHEHLKEQVFVDDLTSLGNRRAYTAYLTAALKGDRRGTDQGDSEMPGRSASRLCSTPADGRDGQDRRSPGPPTRELVVMMLDVDRFKGVNDTYGHDIGDEVLRRIGAILAAQVRSVDLAARLGGDEFVVIMVQEAEGLGEARAEAIINAVESYPWDDVAPGLSISVSLGLQRGRVSELAGLSLEADRQLYVAKRSGRGRISGLDGSGDGAR